MIDGATIRKIGSNGTRIHGAEADGIQLVSFDMGSPEPRADRLDRPRSNGIYDFTRYYGARTFSMKGVLIGTDMEDMVSKRDALAGEFAMTGVQMRFQFHRLGMTNWEYCNVTPASRFSATIDAPGNVMEWEMDLIAADPRMYEIDLESPDPESDTWTNGANTINNAGNFNTPLTFTIDGPWDAGQGIVNNDLSTENQFTFSDAGSGGDTIVIDTGDRTVELNGDRANYMLENNSHFFKAGFGDTELATVGGAFSGGITVEWRHSRI